MEKVKEKPLVLDKEWVLLLEEARKLGVTPRDVRMFLLRSKNGQ
ncbi:anti-repressor SinI family protein [Evansella sp. AB-rgal1]